MAPNPSSFHGLLLSCRVIYKEAAALLYSANRFVLYYAHGHPEPLKPLLALTSLSLASLTNLKIVLNQSSCHQQEPHNNSPFCCRQGREVDGGYSGAYHCKDDHGDRHQLPLLDSASKRNAALENGDDEELAAVQAMLSQWNSAAAHLSYVTSGRLELALVCDIDPQHQLALDIAMSVTAPLRLLPMLKDCSIRLCATPDPRLQQVAQNTVLQACGIGTPPYLKPSTPTTLTSLPRELRLRILEYTDLIVPSREVTWSRQDHGYITFASDSTANPDYHYRVRFFGCWINDDYNPRSFMGCFCRRRHAAFSFICKCWAPPGPGLFLICRTLYQDAQLVFFSGNRFIVHDYRSDPPWELPFLGSDPGSGLEPAPPAPRYTYPNERLAVSQFLREIVPVHCLAYLRFLELVFPPYLPPSWPQEKDPAMQDWWATVDWLQEKINAPGLTLRIVGADVSCWTSDSYRETITIAEGDAIMRAYGHLIRPLRKLADNGLARFYAALPYPWRFTEEVKNRPNRFDWIECRKRELKARAERYVMRDRYESLHANNKAEPETSLWYETHYNQI